MTFNFCNFIKNETNKAHYSFNFITYMYTYPNYITVLDKY